MLEKAEVDIMPETDALKKRKFLALLRLHVCIFSV
jgi:hypothetical protein